MINFYNNKRQIKGYPQAQPSVYYQNCDVVLKEILDQLCCLHKAVCAARADQQDFRAEYMENMGEVKAQLQKLWRNKVWIPRGRF